MDDLTDEERIEAWKSAWHISFDGWAIVEEDFIFRSVNPQWMELLGVLPSEFIGKNFSDITPLEVRLKDEENARLVKDGIISSYLIHKTYQFSDGTVKNIVLLVVRVPIEGHKPFQFYLSRILLDEGELEKQIEKKLQSDGASQNTWIKIVDFLTKYWLPLAIASAAGAGIASEILGLGFF